MLVKAILIIGIIACLGCLIYGLNIRPMNIPHIGCCTASIVCQTSCIVLLSTNNRDILYRAFDVYYIFFAISLWIFYCFVKHLGNTEKFNPYLNPVFCLTIIELVIVSLNLFGMNVLGLTYNSFLGGRYWGIKAIGSFVHIYQVGVIASMLSILIAMVRSIKTTPTIYRGRAISLIVLQMVYAGIYLWVEFKYLPVFILAIGMFPICFIVSYGTYIYPNIKLKASSMTMFTDGLSDCIVLYNGNDKLVHVNGGLGRLLSAERINEFKVKEVFDKWFNNTETYNGILVKKFVFGDSEEKYFETDTVNMQDGVHYLGVMYILRDITTSIQKLQALDEANAELELAAEMKSDFLANMSHEIRTPMNAVIGMAEMALREKMTDNAASYIKQIKSSGRNLLNIINDILDFSKIESGKMDIVVDHYEPLSEINDVANILISRVGSKPVELIVESDPNIPISLEGDMMRIRQIIVNLANNAIKFTKEGRVLLDLRYYKKSDEEIVLQMHVKDTGIGIKEVDKYKLFTSFQQVDSKRNRNVEGTGLGLAITKRLLELMDGWIKFDSVYGEGSDFYFELPQRVTNFEPSVRVSEPEKICVVDCFTNGYLKESLERITQSLKVRYFANADTEIEGTKKVLVFEEKEYSEEIKQRLKADDCEGVILLDFNSDFKPDIPNLRAIRKPLSTIVLGHVLNHESFSFTESGALTDFGFTAPDASVLIVDDNTVNITVAEGLISPLKMKVFTADSGEKAIDMVRKQYFDIIFMDHMMPEMDGVEATRIIRQEIVEAKDTPIIALTANAVSGAKEMFLKEGMNDFVPKPIELRTITASVKRWLPKNLIIENTNPELVDESTASNTEREALEIPGLDVASALELIGSEELYMKVAKDYFKKIDESSLQISDAYGREDWKDYTIKVHALKSSSRQIGATELANLAEQLEKAGNERNLQFIEDNTGKVLELYDSVKEMLRPYFPDKEETVEFDYNSTDILELLDTLLEACDSLDMDALENISKQLKKYAYPDVLTDFMSSLYTSIDDVDTEMCQEIVGQIKSNM